jgi:hypothetical protein
MIDPLKEKTDTAYLKKMLMLRIPDSIREPHSSGKKIYAY